MLKSVRNGIAGLVMLIGSALPSFGQNYTLSGTVRELERTTGAPLTEVRVDVDSSKFIAFTKADGTYSISGIPSGTHNIRISKPGFIGIFKKDYTLDGNKTFNVSLADTIQESPQGTQVLKLDEFRELPPFTTYKGLTRVNEEFPNSQTWNSITEGNLIPVYLANATHYDSTAFRNAIGACNGNWQDSPDGSVEKEQKRALYRLSTDPQTGLVKRGIYVDMDGNNNLTIILGYEANSSYINKVKVEILASFKETIQKELFGRCFNKQDIGGRPSYMNATSKGVTDLDHMLNIVFFNHWAAMPRGEQNANILDMENTPIFVIPSATSIIKPSDNASNLEQNVQIQYNNRFGADRYRLQTSDNENFSNILKDLEVQRTDTTITFDKGKEYFIRVRPENSKGNAPWSSTVRFTTAIAAVVGDIAESGFRIWPVPAGDCLNIEYTPGFRGTRRTYSVTGQLLDIHEVTEDSEVVDMSGTFPGIYIFEFSDGRTKQRVKIIRN